eukprot:Unigene7162_Nuclearia_a/m.21968 Unigene7162_Nuclearia_a/g.21968  ORF Unigene7162_Nuclearia_a/g.21968 Unigene7162_Nuclearia_a/m.21968 type:complete len:335 (+) Unigene7162_Nuclearia_a:1579-2583(+)
MDLPGLGGRAGDRDNQAVPEPDLLRGQRRARDPRDPADLLAAAVGRGGEDVRVRHAAHARHAAGRPGRAPVPAVGHVFGAGHRLWLPVLLHPVHLHGRVRVDVCDDRHGPAPHGLGHHARRRARRAHAHCRHDPAHPPCAVADAARRPRRLPQHCQQLDRDHPPPREHRRVAHGDVRGHRTGRHRLPHLLPRAARLCLQQPADVPQHSHDHSAGHGCRSGADRAGVGHLPRAHYPVLHHVGPRPRAAVGCEQEPVCSPLAQPQDRHDVHALYRLYHLRRDHVYAASAVDPGQPRVGVGRGYCRVEQQHRPTAPARKAQRRAGHAARRRQHERQP